MAIYRLDIQPLSRSAGRRATSAAAYRAGERIRDERTGEWFNHSARKDVLHTEIMLPSRFSAPAGDTTHPDRGTGADMDWARDRSTLWNAAERAEHRRNSRVAREFTVALPFELNPAQRTQLARTFSQELADRYGVAVDLAIHEPRAGGDPRNYHAHLLATTREVTPEGLGAKAGLDMNGTRRQASGLASGLKELVAVRERWATLTNESLRQAHVEARVDHRSLAQQGIDREPTVRIPFAAFQMEKRGVYSQVAERLRERYRARVQARLERGAERLRQARAEGTGRGSSGAWNLEPGDLEEVRRQARQAWLRLRSAQEDRSAGEGKSSTRQADLHAGKQPLAGTGRTGPDDDFAL